MAREDSSNKQTEIKSYDIRSLDLVFESEEVTFNYQHDHDYIIPIKDDLSCNDMINEDEITDDEILDVHSVTIKEEFNENRLKNNGANDVVNQDETENDLDEIYGILSNVKQEKNENDLDDNCDNFCGFNGPDNFFIELPHILVTSEPNFYGNDFSTDFHGFSDVVEPVNSLSVLSYILLNNGIVDNTTMTDSTVVGVGGREETRRVNRKSFTYRCNFCDGQFKTKDTLRRHLATSASCGLVHRVGSVQPSTKSASRRPPGKPHKCSTCEKVLSTRNSWKVHILQHSGNRPFICHNCGKDFFQKAHLVDHIKTHHIDNDYVEEKSKPFYCAGCDIGFLRKRSLLYHQLSHNGVSAGDSKYVPKVRNRPSAMKKDQLFGSIPVDVYYAPDSNEKLFPCPVCCKKFTLLRRMKQHAARMHMTQSLPVSCTYCSKSFLSRYELQLHIPKHTNYRPYTCDLCGRSFTRKSIMHTHRTGHTGEKAYSCNFCPASFNRVSKLTVHLSIHTGQYVYCAVCNKQFAHKSYIIGHFRTHTNEKRRYGRKVKSKSDPLFVECETSYEEK